MNIPPSSIPLHTSITYNNQLPLTTYLFDNTQHEFHCQKAYYMNLNKNNTMTDITTNVFGVNNSRGLIPFTDQHNFEICNQLIFRYMPKAKEYPGEYIITHKLRKFNRNPRGSTPGQSLHRNIVKTTYNGQRYFPIIQNIYYVNNPKHPGTNRNINNQNLLETGLLPKYHYVEGEFVKTVYNSREYYYFNGRGNKKAITRIKGRKGLNVQFNPINGYHWVEKRQVQDQTRQLIVSFVYVKENSPLHLRISEFLNNKIPNSISNISNININNHFVNSHFKSPDQFLAYLVITKILNATQNQNFHVTNNTILKKHINKLYTYGIYLNVDIKIHNFNATSKLIIKFGSLQKSQTLQISWNGSSYKFSTRMHNTKNGLMFKLHKFILEHYNNDEILQHFS